MPTQRRPNLEHWHWVRVTFLIYPWLLLPSGKAMPATTGPLLPSTLPRSQLPTAPFHQLKRERKWGRERFERVREATKKRGIGSNKDLLRK